MGNVQAQCLDYSLALFEIADIFFIDVFCKQDIILRQVCRADGKKRDLLFLSGRLSVR